MAKKSSQSKKDLELFERLCTFFLTLSNSENVLQCIKQVLTLDPNFNPFPLFTYLSRGGTSISKKQLVDFMAENNLSPTDDEIRSLLSSYGCKDKLSYSEFLNYIYPYNTQVIREISTVQIKKYVKTERQPVNEEILCCFVMLLEEELQLIRKLEVQKRDNSLRIGRDKLKKVFKAIKKVSEKQANHTLNSQNVITHLELRTFIRSFKKVEDHQFLNLGRRLSMGRQGIIGLEELEFWIKPWKKEKKMPGDDDYQKLVEDKESDPFINRSASKPQQNKENPYENYKSNLYGELNRSVDGQQEEPYLRHEPAASAEIGEPFLKFVKTYLKYDRLLEHTRTALNSKEDLDMMRLFKRFDRQTRGVINAEDLQKGFYELGGSTSIHGFDLLIQKYAAESGILSYSEFAQLFKPSQDQNNKRPLRRLVPTEDFSHDTARLVIQVIQTNIEAEAELHSIIRGLHPSEVHQLFSLINTERNGYVSYQQLKNYLSCFGVTPSMGELMAILKRFDRNKNGVILQDDFVGVLSC